MRIAIIGIILISVSCNPRVEPGANAGSINISSLDTIKLEYQGGFGSNNSIFLKGYISDFAVDDQGRVFIDASVPGNIGIYVFSPKGEYLRTLSRYGRGPGEFESISSIEIFQNQLFVFDPRLQKYAVFSLNDFTHIYDETIRKPHLEDDEYYQLMRGNHLHALADGSLLLQFQVNRFNDINIHPYIRYYEIEKSGDVMPEKILELRKYQYYMDSIEPGNDGYKLPFTTPFTRSSLFTHNDSFLYSAWSEDFLIQKYNLDGRLLDSIEFPYKKAALDNLSLSDWKKREIEKEELPKTWQTLYAIEADDEGRLWVGTVTESDSTFSWYMINEKDEIVAHFEYPGNKEDIFVRSKPDIRIKDGYFYFHNSNYDEDMDQIEKYKINYRSN